MNAHETFELNPSNSRKNVLAFVVADFHLKHGEAIPELLSEFITLLGNEKEEWDGVKAMRECIKEFFKKFPKIKDKVPTFKDLEEFLFSPNCYVPIEGPDHPNINNEVILGDVGPSTNPETAKGSDHPSTSSKAIVDPPANPKISQGPDHPSTSNAVIIVAANKMKGADTSKMVIPDVVIDPPAKTSKEQDHPNTSKAVGLPANLKALKVKIYMGSGWNNIDFPKLSSTPHLTVNLTLGGGARKKTKALKKRTKTPCWGEEFVFPLSGPKDAELSVEVYDHSRILLKEFAGKILLSVSKLSEGIHTIPLLNQEDKTCESAKLLVRFMFV